MKTKCSIKKAILLRKNRYEIEKKIQAIFRLIEEKLNSIIIYNLENTEFDTLATLTCSCVNSTIKINNMKDYKDFEIDITEVLNSITDRLEDFLIEYCNKNDLKIESEGAYNSATSWLNGKRFNISLLEGK